MSLILSMLQKVTVTLIMYPFFVMRVYIVLCKSLSCLEVGAVSHKLISWLCRALALLEGCVLGKCDPHSFGSEYISPVALLDILMSCHLAASQRYTSW